MRHPATGDPVWYNSRYQFTKEGNIKVKTYLYDDEQCTSLKDKEPARTGDPLVILRTYAENGDTLETSEGELALNIIGKNSINFDNCLIRVDTF